MSNEKKNVYPYKGELPYIFISYSHRNMEEAISIIELLQKDNFRVWYDEGIDPGSEWDENIASHVENCGYFIALLSNEYLESSNCKDELNYARELEKPRLLIYLKDVQLPGGMRMRLSRLQAIHKYKYNSEDLFVKKLEEADGLEQCKHIIKQHSLSHHNKLFNDEVSVIDTIAGKLLLGERYELQNIIGEGGFGAVYKAVDLKSKRTVAVKLGKISAFDSSIVRLHQFLKGKTNEYLCDIYDAATLPKGEAYIVMELFEEGKPLSYYKDFHDLYEEISNAYSMDYPAGGHIMILIDVLKGLKCLHDNGIVHADIQPSNILTNGFQTKLVDYSMAFFEKAGSDPGIDHTFIFGGYSSPEERKDYRSDIYSVGMVAYHWLTGLFPETDIYGNPIFNKDCLNEEMLMILKKATEICPDDRYQTVDDFIGALKQYLKHHTY